MESGERSGQWALSDILYSQLGDPAKPGRTTLGTGHVQALMLHPLPGAGLQQVQARAERARG